MTWVNRSVRETRADMNEMITVLILGLAFRARLIRYVFLIVGDNVSVE